jgi:hypothetical protein
LHGGSSEIFGSYVKVAWDNKEIKAYVDDMRREYQDPDFYKNFEELYNKLKQRPS